jgi:hypothetical protein
LYATTVTRAFADIVNRGFTPLIIVPDPATTVFVIVDEPAFLIVQYIPLAGVDPARLMLVFAVTTNMRAWLFEESTTGLVAALISRKAVTVPFGTLIPAFKTVRVPPVSICT